MASKPFIAARIPEGLNLKLDEHSKATGESRTQALINALATYLGYTSEAPSEQSASDRLSLLEKRVQELEKVWKEPQQILLLDIASEPEIKLQPLTKTDPKTDNKIDNTSSSPLKNTLDNQEMSQLSGIKYETVRSKYRKNVAIELRGKQYLPFKDGKSCKWQST